MAESWSKHPWEPRDGETSQAYDAFVTYRDLGKGRTVRAVSQELAKSYTLVSRWSRRHKWVARAQAWDAHVADRAGTAAVKAAVRAAGSSVEQTLRERNQWLAERKERVRRMIRQGEYLVSFPAREEHRETEKGPLIIKPANTKEIVAGAKIIVTADREMGSIFREELAAAAYQHVAGGELPNLDEARAHEVARLDVLADCLLYSVSRGDIEAGNMLLRVMERKAKLLGLDAMPSNPLTPPAPPPTLVRVEPIAHVNCDDTGDVAPPSAGL